MTGRFWPSESVGAHWGMFPIGPMLDAWGFRIPEEAIIHSVSKVPLGAIVNGRAFIERLEMNYRFEDDGRPLSTNAEWDEMKRCFECMADCLAGLPEPVSVCQKCDDTGRMVTETIQCDCDAAGAKHVD